MIGSMEAQMSRAKQEKEIKADSKEWNKEREIKRQNGFGQIDDIHEQRSHVK